MVDRSLEADVDLVLLGGDFLYSADPDIEVQVGTVLELLAPLTDSGVPIVTVLGNHDHAVGGADELSAARPGLDDADQALREIRDDAPRLVLMHNPTSFPELPAETAPLALAGHTHCGQIALPGSPHWSYLRSTPERSGTGRERSSVPCCSEG